MWSQSIHTTSVSPKLRDVEWWWWWWCIKIMKRLKYISNVIFTSTALHDMYTISINSKWIQKHSRRRCKQNNMNWMCWWLLHSYELVGNRREVAWWWINIWKYVVCLLLKAWIWIFYNVERNASASRILTSLRRDFVINIWLKFNF